MRRGLGVLVLRPDEQRWREVLDGTRHDIYHTPRYVRSEADRLGGEALGFQVEDGDRLFFLPLVLHDSAVAGPRRCSSRDAVSPYGYPGILLSEAAARSDGFVDRCIDAVITRLAEERVCTAFVRLHPLLNASIGEQLTRHVLTESGVTVSLDLTLTEEQMWATMRKGHTNAINKARRAGFTVEVTAPAPFFDEFRTVYAETLRRVGASDTYRFSPAYLRELVAIEDAHLVIARKEGHLAGCYLFYERDGIVQMHLGGTVSTFMQPSPSHLLIHSVARWAKARGDQVLHLGGGLGGSSQDSLFTFKSGFSPRRHLFRTLRLVVDRRRYTELVAAHATQLQTSPESLLASASFPAFRASPSSVAGCVRD